MEHQIKKIICPELGCSSFLHSFLKSLRCLALLYNTTMANIEISYVDQHESVICFLFICHAKLLQAGYHIEAI